jgi:hypothetical protein
VQILVVVANIQVRTLKAEVGKGFARTVFDRESVDPEAQINLVNQTIGYCLFVERQLGSSWFILSISVERESGLIILNLFLDI